MLTLSEQQQKQYDKILDEQGFEAADAYFDQCFLEAEQH